MKKIVCLLFVVFSVFLSSDVALADDVTNPTLDYPSNQSGGIVPLATPDIQEVTLKNNESYDYTKKIVIFPEKMTYVHIRAYAPKNVVSYQLIDDDSGVIAPFQDEKFIDGKAGLNIESHFGRALPGITTPQICEVGIRVRNYEPGAVTFRLGMKISDNYEDNMNSDWWTNNWP